MASIKELIEERKRVTRKLFFVRCCFAWVILVLFLIYEQKPIGFLELAIFVIVIPVLLALYDRFILKR